MEKKIIKKVIDATNMKIIGSFVKGDEDKAIEKLEAIYGEMIEDIGIDRGGDLLS